MKDSFCSASSGSSLSIVRRTEECASKENRLFRDLGSASFGFGFYSTWRHTPWQPPFDGLPITSEDRERIVANITNAMTFMGGRVDFD